MFSFKGETAMKRLFWGFTISLCLMAGFLCAGTGFTAEQAVWKLDFASNQKPENVNVSMKECWDTGDCIRLYTKDSSVTITFNLEKGDYGKYSLEVTDRGTNIKMESASDHKGGVVSPYNIKVNGSAVAEHVDIIWTDFKKSSFEVGKYLKEGNNTVNLTMLIDAKTRYDLKEITLVK